MSARSGRILDDVVAGGAGPAVPRFPRGRARPARPITVSGCPRSRPPAPPEPPEPPPAVDAGPTPSPDAHEPEPDAAPPLAEPEVVISAQRLSTVAEVEALAPLEPGTFRIHLIGVGTGLAILVQGADFKLL